MQKDEQRLFLWLSEILEDPDVTKLPDEVVPSLAWNERVTLLAAREKAGKSTLASAAVAAVSAGSPFLDKETTSQTVLWISLEEHTGEISRRFVEFGGDPDRIAVVSALMKPREELEQIIEEVQPGIIVWDSLSAMADVWAANPLDPAASTGWTRLLRWINDMNRLASSCSIILHHARKSDGKYRDSTAIGANVDVILEMYGSGTTRTLKGVGRWQIPEVKFKLDLEENEYTLLDDGDLDKKVLSFVGKHPGCSWQSLRKGVEGRDEDVKKSRDRLLKRKRLVNKGSQSQHKYHTQLVVPT